MPRRPPVIHHCTSEPLHFFGREAELELLSRGLANEELSVVALIGPGGQGKTAIVQHWLENATRRQDLDGIFLWSFYRGKDSDLCLREMLAYAESAGSQVSASYCVDRLLPVLRNERWAVVLDGTEVVQHESGAWFGRFVNPELGRLIEESASDPMPGVIVLTSRFPLPTLANRRFARTISLETLDPVSARRLLLSLGVTGNESELTEVAQAGGYHAKAVELLGTWLRQFHNGEARNIRHLPPPTKLDGASDEETCIHRVLAGFHKSLSPELKDILSLATAFRSPPTEKRLLEYLASRPVHHLLHETWSRTYAPFDERPAGWLKEQLQILVNLRLLERVGSKLGEPGASATGVSVIDAHPLVRSGFEGAHSEQRARTRAGFLRGRPDRRPPATLDEAREEVELFHAYCDAGLWNEADSVYVALNNPKHRFLAPAFERDLLVRFFPNADWRQPPLWSGFGRYRSLAICFEMMGQFEDAIDCYRGVDVALRGDALIALGRLAPILSQYQVAGMWQNLWLAYRAHALSLAGECDEELLLAASLVPVDVYEWVHVFECQLRACDLAALDLGSLLFQPPMQNEHPWSVLARRRMCLDYARVQGGLVIDDLGAEYRAILDSYDRAGLPFERGLTRLSYCRWLISQGQLDEAAKWNQQTLELAQRHCLRIMEVDALELAAELSQKKGDGAAAARLREEATAKRKECGYLGPPRP